MLEVIIENKRRHDVACIYCSWASFELDPRELDGSEIMYCRRNPPTVVPLQRKDVVSVKTMWPIVTERDYCASFAIEGFEQKIIDTLYEKDYPKDEE